MRSTIGRPRRVTDEQIRIILAWRAEVVQLKAARKAVKTIRQLARELRLSKATISDVVRKHGLFKQPSPEMREAMIPRRRATPSDLRSRRRSTSTVPEVQAAAIERWWNERQALLQQMRAVPGKAAMARELGISRNTLDRILNRGPIERLSRRQAQKLRAWRRSRESIQLQRVCAPGARTFAKRLGIGVSVLLGAVARLKQQR